MYVCTMDFYKNYRKFVKCYELISVRQKHYCIKFSMESLVIQKL